MTTDETGLTFEAPTEVTDQIRRLARLATGQDIEPVFVRSEPGPGDPLDCFPVVDEAAAEHGGEAVIGWRVWQGPFLVEAEFHSVWQRPDGELLDIAPAPMAIDGSLFIRDPSKRYQGRQVDNVRLARTDHPAAADLIAAHKAKSALMNRGDRALETGQIVLSGREARELDAIEARQMRAELALLAASSELAVLPRVGRNDPCPCGSRVKYKRCHGS